MRNYFAKYAKMKEKMNTIGMDYPQLHHSIEYKRQWAAERGVTTTAEGLVVPHSERALLDQKIVGSIEEAAEKIAHARDEGRAVVYLPGSYDLVHIGHLSFIEQAKAHALKGLKRHKPFATEKDIYVLALSDSDALIQLTKYKKHIDHGGTENFYRPIEKDYDPRRRHPRLDAMASLPVDLVGFLPGPSPEENSGLPRIFPLKEREGLEVVEELDVSERAKAKLRFAIDVSARRQQELTMTTPFSIELWQLYLTLALTGKQHAAGDSLLKPFLPGTITRLISTHDSAYLDEVKCISAIAGIAVDIFTDMFAHSTTDLLREFGPEYLLESKKRAMLIP
jgi:hypothetical protein